MNARRDNTCRLGAVYGVLALAGRVLSREGGSKHLELHGENTSDRLKLGLHTLCASLAQAICGLRGIQTVPASPQVLGTRVPGGQTRVLISGHTRL